MTLAKWIVATAMTLGGAMTTPAVFAASNQQVSAVQWQTNFDHAAEEARSLDKPMLVVFTGSDWCGACKKLKSEVLSKPEFAQSFADKFVFVELDFPMRGRQPSGQAERNKALQQRFGVRGFPTVIVLDSDQKQVGQSIVGYGGGGVSSYVAQLDSIK